MPSKVKPRRIPKVQPPSKRLYTAMTAGQDVAQNLLDDLNESGASSLSTTDLTMALEDAMAARVVLDKTSDREEQHGDAQDLKDALEDAAAEASMLASEARSIEKRLERALAQVRKYDTFKLPKERK